MIFFEFYLRNTLNKIVFHKVACIRVIGDCWVSGYCVGVITLGMKRGNSATLNVVNKGLEEFPTVFEAHGIHSPASANVEKMNDVGTIHNVANNGTTVGPNPASNNPGMSTSYANVTGEPSRKALNFRTLFTPARKRIDLVQPVESVRAISKRSSYARALIEIRADVELKDNIVVAMPNLLERGSIRVIFVLSMSENLRGVRVARLNYPDDHDSEDEVESVDNDMARSLASKRVGFGINSLLEQRRGTYENVDYDYDPYDDDMYEG
nr:hypothetical protein [Tanacetum cinerariifolium]